MRAAAPDKSYRRRSVKQAGDTASDADWQIPSQREGVLKMLLRSSSPAAVAEVGADLRLSSATVYRLLAVYRSDIIDQFPSTQSRLPCLGNKSAQHRGRDRHPNVDLRVLLEEAAAACCRSPPAGHPGMPKGQTCTSFVQSGVGSGQLCRPSAHSTKKRRSGSCTRQVCASQEGAGSEASARTRTNRPHTRGHHGRR